MTNKIRATFDFNKQFISILSFPISTLWSDNLCDDDDKDSTSRLLILSANINCCCSALV
jgi:hypothetical protein